LRLLNKGPRGSEICRRLIIDKGSSLKTEQFVGLDFPVAVGGSTGWIILAHDFNK
jgi:hypothetical protein